MDKIVYDVSHQSYPHKMLTGRKDAYLYEEHFEDVSGYTNPEESEHDFFNVGHTSTSISLASGLVKARDLKGDKENNLDTLIHTFYDIKDINHPIVVHINTQKGKGYQIAEENKENWHWCMPFDVETGKPKVTFEGENYGDLTADYLLDKMKKDSKVVTLVAGVPTNIGFTKDKREQVI